MYHRNVICSVEGINWRFNVHWNVGQPPGCLRFALADRLIWEMGMMWLSSLTSSWFSSTGFHPVKEMEERQENQMEKVLISECVVLGLTLVSLAPYVSKIYSLYHKFCFGLFGPFCGFFWSQLPWDELCCASTGHFPHQRSGVERSSRVTCLSFCPAVGSSVVRSTLSLCSFIFSKWERDLSITNVVLQ